MDPPTNKLHSLWPHASYRGVHFSQALRRDMKTAVAFGSEGHVLVCAVVENEGPFGATMVVETKGHFVAKAILSGKNGTQQPHYIPPRCPKLVNNVCRVQT